MNNNVTQWIMTFITNSVITVNTVYKSLDKICDYLSVNVCLEKPTYNLVAENLHIPEDESVLAQIFNAIQKAAGVIIVPVKMLNDKKFAVHVYESAATFTTQNVTMPQNIVTTCEKMLIYISSDKNKIIERTYNQVIKTVNLHDVEYEIPVNYWYTYNIDNTHKVFFYVHVSIIQNYKSVIIAVDKNIEADNSFLAKMKQDALNYYDQTLGINNTIFCTNERMDFI